MKLDNIMFMNVKLSSRVSARMRAKASALQARGRQLAHATRGGGRP